MVAVNGKKCTNSFYFILFEAVISSYKNTYYTIFVFNVNKYAFVEYAE